MSQSPSSSPSFATVLILIKNPGKIFEDVLSSALAQKTTFPFDVLLIDSGSTDGTIEKIKNHNASHVRLIEIPPQDFGHGKTRNYGISLCNSKYVALLTHDAIPANENWLQSLVDVAESDPDIAGVFGRHIAHKNANYFTRRELNLHFQGFQKDPIVMLDDSARYQADVGYRQYLHFFSDNNSLVNKSVWGKIPYPDVNFAEDQIWAKKIIEAGYKKAYSHDGVVHHSHDYKLVERLQRSFDESAAFARYFDYNLLPSLKAFLRVWIGVTISELSDIKKEKSILKNFKDFCRQPFYNFMKFLGLYLGSHKAYLSQSLQDKLSYDKKLFAGTRRGK